MVAWVRVELVLTVRYDARSANLTDHSKRELLNPAARVSFSKLNWKISLLGAQPL